MPRFRLTLEFDGSAFVGWQFQPNGLSVQEVVETAIERLCGQPQPRIMSAGRTDAGVHALGMVAHADIARDMTPARLMGALNFHLRPHPVVVRAVALTTPEFDARRSCLQRHYIYRIVNRVAPPALDLGRVWHVATPLDLPAMQAAAIDLGQGVTGFLRAADARVLEEGAGDKRQPLKKLLRRGQTVLVQAVRRAADGKQIRLTADIALQGRYLNLYPLRQGVDVPKRIGDPDQRDALQALLEGLNMAGRAVARPVSARVAPELVSADATRLAAAWQRIAEAQAGPNAPAPALLHAAPDLLLRALTEIAPPSPEMIAVSDRTLAADLHQLAAQHAPDLQPLVGIAPPGEGLELDQVLDEALATDVALPGGGRISIEVTKALTAIDIDSAGARSTPIDLNMRAIPEIAHHLRLRRIGGPVVIDFISMKAGNERKRVEAALRRAFERDPVMVDIGQVDRFSLATMVRGRGESGLSQHMLAPRAAEPDLQPAIVAARVLRKVAAELSGIGPLPMTLHLSAQFRDLFGDDATARTSAFLGRPITLVFDDRAAESYTVARNR